MSKVGLWVTPKHYVKYESTLLKNALVLSDTRPYHFKRADVLIEENTIAMVCPTIIDPRSVEIDCRNRVIIPGLVNAHAHAAMSLLRGIGDDLPVPQWLKTAIWPYERHMSGEDVYAGVLLACAEMMRAGITTFNDKFFHSTNAFNATDLSGMRALLGQSMRNSKTFKDDKEGMQDALDFTAVVNQSGHPRIKASLTPPDIQRIKPEDLAWIGNMAQAGPTPLHIHVAETKGEVGYTREKFGMGPIEFLDKSHCLFGQSILAHATHVKKKEVRLISQSGASVVFNPRANMRHANGGLTPVVEYLANNVNVAMGTDSAPSNGVLDIFTTGATGAAIQKHLRGDAGAIKADDILYMMTEGGARALGIKSGRIAGGYLADLVMLNLRSPNLVPYNDNAGWLVYSAGPQNVTDVMVEGKFILRNGEIQTFNEEDVLVEAQKRSDALRRRAQNST